jgi:hypothetical protein
MYNTLKNLLRRHCTTQWFNKIGNVYSLEYTDIQKVFFTPHHVGRCCTNLIRGHCCILGHSCTSFIPCHCCPSSNNWPKVVLALMRSEVPLLRKTPRGRHTDMDGPIRCSSLTLEREENWKRTVLLIQVF